jgi:hypothetical protein
MSSFIVAFGYGSGKLLAQGIFTPIARKYLKITHLAKAKAG